MTPKWWSQPFAEEGSATAEGIVNQLGRPALGELTVLVREAAQNSWDARIGDQDVHFSIDIRKLEAFSGAWNELLLPAPAGGDVRLLAEHLHPDSVVVTISDRGTRGLGGPLRAGTKPQVGERSDFVQFLRNVGEARDNEFGGGTYGFGKGIFYRLSQCSSIVVDSFTGDGSSHERRLMGAALGSSFYDESDRRFTGRHWWGIDIDNIPDPVLGDQAAAIAASLGLPGFEDGSTGTDIVIIGARLTSTGSEGVDEDDALLDAARFIASSILWNLWPKMIPQAHLPTMRFAVTVQGEQVLVPDPLTCADLKPFALSLVALRNGDNAKYTRTREPRLAGELKISNGPNFGGSESAVVTAAKPFEGPAHHVARMRVAELIVDYHAGPPHPDELFTYGGVFRTVKESDSFFAESEPPTHDDWVVAALQGTARGVVQGSKQFLNKKIAEHIGVSGSVVTTSLSGLGKLASRLSRLAPGVVSGGAGPGQSASSGGNTSGSGGRGGRSTKRIARVVEPPKVAVFDGQPFVVTRVLVPASDSPLICAAKASVILDGGGRESESFAGADVPTVLQWQPVAGGPAVHAPSIQIHSAVDTEWWVYASYVADAVTRIELDTTNGQL